MDIYLIYKSVIYAGLIVVFLVEVVKRSLKNAKGTKEKPWKLPTWLGMTLGSVTSLVVSFLFYMAWLRPGSVWIYLIQTISIFLFQYFISMEVAKRLFVRISKRDGFDLDPILGGD